MNQNEKAIAALLANDQEALNQSDTNSVMKLYASHDVFIQQHSPSSGGADAIRKAYDAVFNTIKLDVDFKVAEVHQIGPRLGFCAHQLGREGHGQGDRQERSGGQPRALLVPQNRRHLEDRARLLFHNQPSARINKTLFRSTLSAVLRLIGLELTQTLSALPPPLVGFMEAAGLVLHQGWSAP